MPESLDIWKLLAKLGIFMFGMFQMEESVTKATAERTIQALNISTMLLVNRAFNQPSRQLIFTLKNVLLTTVELNLLEKLTDE
ncbi:MAG: hypothetical protein ACJAVL_000111 [Bacteroidia bacterium]|jgi:hypothetical protein